MGRNQKGLCTSFERERCGRDCRKNGYDVNPSLTRFLKVTGLELCQSLDFISIDEKYEKDHQFRRYIEENKYVFVLLFHASFELGLFLLRSEDVISLPYLSVSFMMWGLKS